MKNNKIIRLIFLLYIIIGFVFLFFPIIHNKIATDTYITTSLQDLYQTEKIYQSDEIIRFIYPLINPASSIKYCLYSLVSETQALNIYSILLFALAGLGTYLTANLFIKNNFYSFIAGFAYAVLSLYFLQVELVAIIPFFTFFLIRFYYSNSKRNLILLLVTLIFVVNLALEDIAFILLFTTIFIGFYVFKNWKSWNKRFVFSLLVIFVLLVSSAGLKYQFSKSSLNVIDTQLLNSTSVELASSLMPFQHLFFDNTQVGIPFLSKADFQTPYIYLGILPLIFIILALRTKRDDELFSFLKISGICFFILSLGPYLKIGNFIKSLLPLPYLFLYRFVSIFDRLEDIKKLYILAYLPMTILLGMGLKILFNKFRHKKVSKVILTVAIVILAVELSYFPQAEFLFKPAFIKYFASSHEEFSIIYLFLNGTQKNNLVTTYITETDLSEGNIFSAPIENQNNNEQIYNRLLFYNIANKKQEEESFITTKIKDEISYRWDDDNIKYIILNKNGLEVQIIDNLQKIFRELKLKKYTEEDGLIVYQTKVAPPSLRVIPGSGWTGDFETDQANSYNLRPKSAWSSWESNIEIINNSQKEKNIFLEFFAKSDDHRFLTISRNGEEVKKLFIGPENQAFRIFLNHLKTGKTTVSFFTPKRYLADQVNAEPRIKFADIYYDEIKGLKVSGIYPVIYQRIFNESGDFKIWQTPFQTAYNFTNKSPKETFSYDNFLDLVELTNDAVAIRDTDIGRVTLCSVIPFFAVGIGGWDFVERNYDIFDHESINTCGGALFNRYNIKYLIIEKKFIERKHNIEIGIRYYKTYIQNTFPSATIYWEDDESLVYQFSNTPTSYNILTNLREGFGDLILGKEDAQIKKPHRQVYDGANIELVNISSDPIVKNIKFSLQSSNGNTKVRILLNKKEVGNYTITSEIQMINLLALELDPGVNYLTFQIEENYDKSILHISQFKY